MDKKFIILIIDDSRIVVDRLTAFFEAFNHVEKVVAGDSYEKTKALIETHQVDVALIDINLPGRSGIEILRLLKNKNYPIGKIIMMTVDPSHEKEQLCLSLGAHHFVSKFEEFEKIIELVENLQ